MWPVSGPLKISRRDDLCEADAPVEYTAAEDAVEMGKVQMILAEKRTSLSSLRTGIAVFTLPLSVTTVLVTTSRFYDFLENLHYLIPLLCLCLLLVGVGGYLILMALIRIRNHHRQIEKIKRGHPAWHDLLD
jgi:uncharacterized membrane protein YidH (DUF202 family)